LDNFGSIVSVIVGLGVLREGTDDDVNVEVLILVNPFRKVDDSDVSHPWFFNVKETPIAVCCDGSRSNSFLIVVCYESQGSVEVTRLHIPILGAATN
jgi:hypothetical protein